VTSDLERTWKKAFVAYFEVLFWYLPDWTEENHEKFQGLRIEPGTPRNM
jgi:hypothetical protein